MQTFTTLPAAVRQATPSPKVSERYVHVNTNDVVALMAEEGYRVASVQMPKSKLRDPLYMKHLVDFRREDWKGDAREPRLLFTNAHDGSSSTNFMLGVYEYACSNGLVVGSTYAAAKVRHVGEEAMSLINRVRDLARNTTPLFTQIEDWQKKQLTKGQRHEFARLASMLRWGDPHRFEVEDLLAVRRSEDDRGDLWSTFQRVQESTVRGGMTGLSRSGRQATARPLSAIDTNTNYNAKLWTLAEEFAGL